MSRKLLNIPLIIWIAQIGYVVIALMLLYVLIRTYKPINQYRFIAIYIFIMVVVDILWRLIAGRYLK